MVAHCEFHSCRHVEIIFMSIRFRDRAYRPGCEHLECRITLSTAHHSVAAIASVRLASSKPRPIHHTAISGLVPLDQLGPGTSYQGFSGGLYGNGSNQPPPSLLDAANVAAGQVVPRGIYGAPSNSGKVGVIAIGQSTTKQWFPYFQRLSAGRLPGQFVLVNAGQDSVVAQNWASSPQPWSVADSLVAASRLSRYQVQVAIIDSARIRSWNDGDLPSQVNAYSSNLARIVSIAKAHYPNLSLVYFLPFHDSEFVSPRRMLQEPFSYQLGFGIQHLVTTQGTGSPVLLWGPYIWADMADPSFYYDGIHFRPAGRAAMASLMWSFLQTDPVAARWLWNGLPATPPPPQPPVPINPPQPPVPLNPLPPVVFPIPVQLH
jgi:hypothetical protein